MIWSHRGKGKGLSPESDPGLTRGSASCWLCDLHTLRDHSESEF